MVGEEEKKTPIQDLKVDIKVPSNFKSFRAGFKCPNCQNEIKRSLRGRSVKHRIKCRSCSEVITVSIYDRTGKSA
jgi:predicted RNA-binding Zn-ribbon protein involved in translation (DUF1610 family)